MACALPNMACGLRNMACAPSHALGRPKSPSNLSEASSTPPTSAHRGPLLDVTVDLHSVTCTDVSEVRRAPCATAQGRLATPRTSTPWHGRG
eukprot:7292964-Prymnesium_polylepis.1